MRRVGGWLTLLCALFGLPVALVTTRQVWLDLDVGAAAAEPMTVPVLVFAVAATGWLLWAWLVVAVVLDVAAVLTHGAWAVRLLPAPLRTTVTTLAGSLLMGITSVTAGSSAAGGAPPSGTAMHTVGPPTEVLPASAADAATAIPDLVRVSVDTSIVPVRQVTGPGSAALRTHRTHGQPMTVTVRRGDTLWSISERCLGDPHRWQEIYRLNAGRYDRAGRMHGGDHIEPAWVLTLPDDTPPAPTTHTDPGSGAVTAPPAAQTQPSIPGPPAGVDGQAPDDGVTDEHPSSPASVSVTPVPAGTGVDTGARTGQTDRQEPGFQLFSGSWVDAGLAAAIIAAAALVWAHRRRRYTPATPSAVARSHDTDIAAMPAVVRMLRRRTDASSPGRSATVAPAADPAPADAHAGSGTDADDGNDHRIAAEEPRLSPDAIVEHQLGGDHDAGHADRAEEDRNSAGADRIRPGSGWRRPAGLGLVGGGADAAARGLLVTAVADGADDPAARTVVVIPASTAGRLFGTGPTLPDMPRIVITDGLPEALDRIETGALHRSRVLQQHAVDTVAEVRRADPLEEPLPPIVLLTDASDVHGGRVAALLQQGRRLDIHGVLLGAWPHGDTATVAADGTTSPATPNSASPTATTAASSARHAADVGRLTVLTVTEAVDLLNVLAEAHTGQPPASSGGSTPPDDTSDPATGTTHGGIARPGPDVAPAPAPRPAAPGSAGAAEQPRPPDAPEPDPAVAVGSGAGADDAITEVPTGPAGRVSVELLGAPRVVNAEASQDPLRPKSLELLAYLAVHDTPVHYESILDDLLPDAPANKAVHRLHTYVSNLRHVLRHAGGAGTYIIRTGQRYLLNRDAFDVDLWQLRAAIQQAELADDPAERIAARQHAVQTYRGHLADGVDYEWVEPHREAARRHAVDAALALADALADEPDRVLRILDAAIGHSPYTEVLYQAAMRANAALGRPDTVRALRHTLTRQLADLDAEPSDETSALADRLLTATPTATRRNPRQQPSRPDQPDQPNQPDQPQRTGTPAIRAADDRTGPRATQTTVPAPGGPLPPLPPLPVRPVRGTDTDADAAA
ncbi:LysM peptidoglycan-binding domain-containing protein [Dactylosporangium sp. NBC_01737]|uniref:BTAD domain-containing putative transcriptional regulator n=1 Tax=Dactylosporangium sp. NBC_01737 TaxID=2975959 RepID=UPI002E109F39|nr:LysM peptidoglycan-binding domain-containing protein [Dactylosporangium sp. NBC_01737]